MNVIVTDLCGRKPPTTLNLADAADYLGLDRSDIEYIEDTIDESGVAYIGEIEYRPAVIKVQK